MNEITINKEKVAEAYQNASAETKEALKALFGNEIEFKRKPTLDDYTTIKTYEDACEALGMVPILNQSDYELTDDNGYMVYFPPHIIALMKLETISRALWGRTWEPKPDAEGSKWFYYPVFTLYTKSETEDMDADKRRNLLSANAKSSATTGFGSLHINGCSPSAYTYTEFRLCQETGEKTEYFCKQFIELWAEYLKFNFEVGERLKCEMSEKELNKPCEKV